MIASCVMNSVARKYAKAFYNLYGCKFNEGVIDKIQRLITRLQGNKRLFVFLNLPVVSQEQKISAHYEICDSVSAPEEIKVLIKPLLHQRRIEILRDVLALFVLYYRKQQNIVVCTVTTSSSLSVDEQKEIKVLMSDTLKASVIAEFAVSSTLIKGVRIQSDNVLWECSMAQRLRALENTVLQRVRLW